MQRIILFDGICNFCNSSVQFIIRRDPNGHFNFASLQSEIGRELLKKYGLKEDLSSFVLIEGEKCYVKSSAALKVCKQLKGVWKFFIVFQVIPRFLRDFIYDIIVKYRYKWFGQQESCMLPSLEIKERFLD